MDDADARAEFYDKHFVPAAFADWALLLVDAANVAPRQHILDVACGTGIVARIVADRVEGHVEIVGIDLSASMIKVARRHCPDIDWHQADAASLPFADGSFDVVLCQAALKFFPDQVLALQEMRRVLCSSGRIAVLVPGASPCFDMTGEILEEIAGREAVKTFLSGFTLREPSAVTSLFAKAGFKSAHLQTHQGAMRYPSMEAFLQGHISWLLRGRVRVDAMRTAARDILELFCTGTAAMHIPVEVHIVVASKD